MPIVAAYPAAIPTFITKVDDEDTVYADHINALQVEVRAIAQTLGTSPAGSAASVKARIAAAEVDLAEIAERFNPDGTLPQVGVEDLISPGHFPISFYFYQAAGLTMGEQTQIWPVVNNITLLRAILTASSSGATMRLLSSGTQLSPTSSQTSSTPGPTAKIIQDFTDVDVNAGAAISVELQKPGVSGALVWAAVTIEARWR